MILDYSQSAARKAAPHRWFRAFWSHQTRLELAQSLSVSQGVGLVLAISILAGALSSSHLCLRTLIQAFTATPGPSLAAIKANLLASTVAAGQIALLVAPIYFLILLGGTTLAAAIWTKVLRRGGAFSETFPVFSVGSVPLLWFFVLLQLEGIAPFVSHSTVLADFWNPLTNSLRFAVLMIGILLLGLWFSDTARLHRGIRRAKP